MSEPEDHRPEQNDDPMSVSRLPQEEELRFSAPAPEIEGYQILEKLGEAGQGQVWRAVQRSTGRQVALKVPRIGLLSSKKTLARFEREVEIAAQLKHPHIARIIDSGVHRGLYYYAMDLIEGKHLDQYVKDNGLSQRQILELMRTICEAVQHAHQNGVIHRDLKPSNIIVTEAGHPYIVDFGLAKSLVESQVSVTVSVDGEAAGTPAFMSPEQAGGQADRVDTRTDVYSLGAILYALLTSRNPHDLSGSHYDVLHRIAEQEVTRPRKLDRRMDRDLESLLLKALERDPGRRYSSAAGLAEDIDHYLQGLPLSATPRSRMRRVESFVCRHRVGVGLGLLISALGLTAVVALTAGMMLLSQEKQRTQRALEREEEALREETQARREAIQQRDLAYRNLYVAQIRLAPQYWEAGQIRKLKDMLEDYTPTPRETDLRGWEWYYLLSLCHKDLLTLSGHTTGVTSAAWSPDGRLVASACKAGTVRIWDAATGQECRILRGHTNGVSEVTWSPDGKLLASASGDHTARIWEVATGQEVLRFSGHAGSVNAIAWSPDGNELATGSDDCTVRLWDFRTGVENLVFTAHTSIVQSLAWRADGRYVASGDGQGWLRIWEAQTGKETRALRPHTNDLWSVAWSPDGNSIASTGYGHPLIVWDVATGQRRQTIPLPASGTSATWSPDGGLIAVATLSQLVQVWNPQTGQKVATLRGHAGAVNSVVFSPDGKLLLSSGDDQVVKIWDMNEPKSATVLSHPKAAAIAWNPKGDILASAGGGVVRLWDVRTARECAMWNTRLFCESDGAPEISMAWNPEGSRIAIGRWGPPGEEIGVWDSNTGEEVVRLSKGSNPAWSPDGERLAISTGTTVEVWDLHRNSIAYRLTGHGGSVYSISWSPGGDRLATGEWGPVRIWDGKTGDLLRTFDRHRNWVGTISWTADGERVASGGWGHDIYVWDARSGRELTRLEGHTGAIICVQWSPTGERIASGSSDNSAKVWDVTTSRELLTLQGHTDMVRSVAWSPDGRQLATASQDGTVRVWDATKGYEMLAGSSRTPGFDSSAAGLFRGGVATPEAKCDLKGTMITRVTASSNYEVDLSSLLDGGGLGDWDNDGLTEHDTDTRHMWLAGPGEGAWLEFDLGRTCMLEAIRVWNLNIQGQTDKGVSRADIFVWTKSGGWTKLLDNLQFGEATGGNDYDDPAIIPLGGVEAERVQLADLVSFDDPQHVGLAEVQFFDLSEREATRPSPADGSDVGPSRTVSLRWTSPPDAVTCRVYFGDDPQNLALLGTVAADQGLEARELERQKWYCWRVDTIRGDGSTAKGKLWSFSTGNMVGWWKLDETAGQTLADSSGRGKHGKIMGNPPWRQGHKGGALELDGKDDYIRVEDESDGGIGLQITVACWIKVAGFAIPWQPAVSRGGTGSWRLIRAADARGMELACNGVNVPGTRWGNVRGTKTVDDGRWHHVVGTYDGTKLCLYVDGSLDISINGSGRINLSNDPILIGANAPDPKSRWNGLIDDVRIYSYALTPDEVQALYADSGPGPLPKPTWAGVSPEP